MNEVSYSSASEPLSVESLWAVVLVVDSRAYSAVMQWLYLSRLIIIIDDCGRSTDTSDPGHFGPKTVRHYVFGTEMSYFFSTGAEVSLLFGTLRHQCRTPLLYCGRTVSTFYEGAEVSNGHFGTGTEVSWTDRRRVLVLVSLHHLTSHLHHPSRSPDSVSRHIVCIYEIMPDIHIWLITHFNNISLFPVHFSINYLGRTTMWRDGTTGWTSRRTMAGWIFTSWFSCCTQSLSWSTRQREDAVRMWHDAFTEERVQQAAFETTSAVERILW